MCNGGSLQACIFCSLRLDTGVDSTVGTCSSESFSSDRLQRSTVDQTSKLNVITDLLLPSLLLVTPGRPFPLYSEVLFVNIISVIITLAAGLTFLGCFGGPHSISALLALRQGQTGPAGEQQSPCWLLRCAFLAPCLIQRCTCVHTPRVRQSACRSPIGMTTLRPRANIWERGRG